MIRFVSGGLEQLFVDSLPGFGVYAAKLMAQLGTYGADSGIADFWLVLDRQDRPVGAISKLDGALTAALGEGAQDWEELAAFLSAVGGRFVDSELPAIQRLHKILGGRITSSWVMEEAACGNVAAARERLRLLRGSCGQPGSRPADILPADSLRAVFDLLCKGDSSFAAQAVYEPWLAEVSHRVRHGLAEVYTLNVLNNMVSTIGNYFIGAGRCVLAGLATDPAEAGQGYGQLMMAHATARAYEMGLRPCLLTADDRLAAFHNRCGYEATGRWGRLLK